MVTWVPWSPSNPETFHAIKCGEGRGERKLAWELGTKPTAPGCVIDVLPVDGRRVEVKEVSPGQRTFRTGVYGARHASSFVDTVRACVTEMLEFSRGRNSEEHLLRMQRRLECGDIPKGMVFGGTETFRIGLIAFAHLFSQTFIPLKERALQDPTIIKMLWDGLDPVSVLGPHVDVVALVNEDRGYSLVERDDWDETFVIDRVIRLSPSFRCVPSVFVGWPKKAKED